MNELQEMNERFEDIKEIKQIGIDISDRADIVQSIVVMYESRDADGNWRTCFNWKGSYQAAIGMLETTKNEMLKLSREEIVND